MHKLLKEKVSGVRNNPSHVPQAIVNQSIRKRVPRPLGLQSAPAGPSKATNGQHRFVGRYHGYQILEVRVRGKPSFLYRREP